MPITTRSLVPFAHVQSVPRSIVFYQQLGFSAVDTFVPAGETEPSWAWLECDKAHLMIGKASEPVVPAQQAVFFYLFVDEVAAVREELLAAGVAAGEIAYPFYAPRGEFRITDPDGYTLMITHT